MNQTKITITFTTYPQVVLYVRERDRAKQNVSRIAILSVCHAEQPIPVLFLRLSPLTAHHGTVRVAVIPIKTTRVTAIVTCALRLGM